MSLPTGTITFLFTDIEGSTRMWEAYPEAMQMALVRHDILIREAIADANGYVFKTMGDAFCAAFSTATDALNAVLAVQTGIHREFWPSETPIKVRLAVHTGVAECRQNDYFGPPINRISRLISTGHGGQALLSQSTYELIRLQLPESVSLLDLGTHFLKDIAQPEHIYQIQHPELDSAFPPLRSLTDPHLRHNLPSEVSSFIGREKELNDLASLLESNRLITLVGSGGCGKTRLAIRLAADQTNSMDGVWFVELAALTNPSFVPQTIAQALGLKEDSDQDVVHVLKQYFKNGNHLLLFDNCEHVLDSCARLAQTLLHDCPNLKLLVTSREPLRISGENAYRVPSLSLPDLKTLELPERIVEYEAVRLFVERARSHQTKFVVTHRNASALVSVCLRLDGIPLAIELAAARVRALTVDEIDNRLDQRFKLLTGGSRTALPRQQTLRSLIDWSHDLLNDAEKALFCRLSVFSGGWTLDSAESVCSAKPVETWEVLDLMESLSDKSLLVTEIAGDAVRYRMLESIRQYADDQLSERGDTEAYRNNHLNHFLTFAEEAEPNLTGLEQLVWLDRLEAEHANLRMGLEWSEHSIDQSELGLRLATAIWRFWYVRGHLSEGRERLRRALAAASNSDVMLRSKALNGAGILAFDQADYPAARALYEESLAIRRGLNDRSGIAASLGNLGLVAFRQGDHTTAVEMHKESLALQRELSDLHGIANALNNLGNVVYYTEGSAAARALHQESLQLDRQLGNLRGMAISLNNLGLSAQHDGDYAAARPLHLESLEISSELGDRWAVAVSLEGLASCALAHGDPVRAARLWSFAERLREEIGSPLPPNERSTYDEEVAAARAVIGESGFEAARQASNGMTLEEVVEYAKA